MIFFYTCMHTQRKERRESGQREREIENEYDSPKFLALYHLPACEQNILMDKFI